MNSTSYYPPQCYSSTALGTVSDLKSSPAAAVADAPYALNSMLSAAVASAAGGEAVDASFAANVSLPQTYPSFLPSTSAFNWSAMQNMCAQPFQAGLGVPIQSTAFPSTSYDPRFGGAADQLNKWHNSFADQLTAGYGAAPTSLPYGTFGDFCQLGAFDGYAATNSDEMESLRMALQHYGAITVPTVGGGNGNSAGQPSASSSSLSANSVGFRYHKEPDANLTASDGNKATTIQPVAESTSVIRAKNELMEVDSNNFNATAKSSLNFLNGMPQLPQYVGLNGLDGVGGLNGELPSGGAGGASLAAMAAAQMAAYRNGAAAAAVAGDFYAAAANSEALRFFAQQRPSPPHKYGPGSNNVRVRTNDKYRSVYTEQQRLELEKEYHASPFINADRKAELSTFLRLTERQIKIWFQNRRAKKRKAEKVHHHIPHNAWQSS